MPTKPHASTSCSVVVLVLGLRVAMFISPLCPSAAGRWPSAVRCRDVSLAFMWKRSSTALTKKLQMKPITSSPAMMYMVVL